MGRRVRTFIAVEVAPAIRQRIVDLQQALARAGAEVKWVEEENLHVTLVFLGEVHDTEIPTVCRIAQGAVADFAPFALAVGGVGCFPNARRPRIVWVGLGAGADRLVTIHDRLEGPLQDLGYRREDRPYTPHVTLGRVQKDTGGAPLAAALAKHAGWHGGELTVREVLIMGSELTRDGPRYTVLGRAKFLGHAAEEEE